MARRRRGNGKRKFACMHVGKGTECRRCEKATEIEAMVDRGEKLLTNKKLPKPKTWTKDEMVEEVKRLRSVRFV